MDKLAANITQAGTFLFRAPANNQQITQRHINTNMVAWIFDPKDADEYVELLQIDRFVLTRNQKEISYTTRDEIVEEITKEDAKKLYGLMKQLREEKQTQKPQQFQKINK